MHRVIYKLLDKKQMNFFCFNSGHIPPKYFIKHLKTQAKKKNI